MQIAIQIFGFLSIVGGIAITILLYYHKQTPAIWVTFLTIMSLTLSLCLNWQQSINTTQRPAEQMLIVSPDTIDLGKGDWKAKSQFSIHNPTDEFFYHIWLKLYVNSESLSYLDFDVIPPQNLPSSFLEFADTRVNSSLIRLDGLDQYNKSCIYLVLETLAPKMTHRFELLNTSTNDLPSLVHSVDISILRYWDEPTKRMQDGKTGAMFFHPPEEIRMMRTFILTEEGTLKLGNIKNEPGVIPNWSERQQKNPSDKE